MGLHDVAVDPEGKFVYTVEAQESSSKNFILMEALLQMGI